MARIEIGLRERRRRLRRDPARLHEFHRIRNSRRHCLVAVCRGGALHKPQHPAMDVVEAGIAALRERPQQVQRRRRLQVRLQQALRIRRTRLGRELHSVDVVAAIGRQRHAIDRLDRRRTRLGELSRDAPNLHDRLLARECQHHGHLQDQAERVADVVRVKLLETLGTVATLQQESLALRHITQPRSKRARLTGEHQRRIARQLLLDSRQLVHVRIVRRNVQRRLPPPRVRRPASRTSRSIRRAHVAACSNRTGAFKHVAKARINPVVLTHNTRSTLQY